MGTLGNPPIVTRGERELVLMRTSSQQSLTVKVVPDRYRVSGGAVLNSDGVLAQGNVGK